QVDVLDGAMRRLQHEIAELTVGRVQSGRIDEYHLSAREILDPGDAIARRLRSPEDDRQLLADQTIQERRFPGVGPADQRHESGAAGHRTDAPELRVDRRLLDVPTVRAARPTRREAGSGASR